MPKPKKLSKKEIQKEHEKQAKLEELRKQVPVFKMGQPWNVAEMKKALMLLAEVQKTESSDSVSINVQEAAIHYDTIDLLIQGTQARRVAEGYNAEGAYMTDKSNIYQTSIDFFKALGLDEDAGAHVLLYRRVYDDGILHVPDLDSYQNYLCYAIVQRIQNAENELSDMKTMNKFYDDYAGYLASINSDEINRIKDKLLIAWNYTNDRKPGNVAKELKSKLGELYLYNNGKKYLTDKKALELQQEIKQLLPSSTNTDMPLLEFDESKLNTNELWKSLQTYADTMLDYDDKVAERKAAAELHKANVQIIENAIGEQISKDDFKQAFDYDKFSDRFNLYYRLSGLAESERTLFGPKSGLEDTLKELESYLTSNDFIFEQNEKLDDIPKIMQKRTEGVRLILLYQMQKILDYKYAPDAYLPEIQKNGNRKDYLDNLKDLGELPDRLMRDYIQNVGEELEKRSDYSPLVSEDYGYDFVNGGSTQEYNDELTNSILSSCKEQELSSEKIEPILKGHLDTLFHWLNTDPKALCAKDSHGMLVYEEGVLSKSTEDIIVNVYNSLNYIKNISKIAGAEGLFEQPIYERQKIADELKGFKTHLEKTKENKKELEDLINKMRELNEADRSRNWYVLTFDELQEQVENRGALKAQADARLKNLKSFFSEGYIRENLKGKWTELIDLQKALEETDNRLRTEIVPHAVNIKLEKDNLDKMLQIMADSDAAAKAAKERQQLHDSIAVICGVIKDENHVKHQEFTTMKEALNAYEIALAKNNNAKAAAEEVYKACAKYLAIHTEIKVKDDKNIPVIGGQMTESGRVRKQAAVLTMEILAKENKEMAERLDADLKIKSKDIEGLKASLKKAAGQEKSKETQAPYFDLKVRADKQKRAQNEHKAEPKERKIDKQPTKQLHN